MALVVFVSFWTYALFFASKEAVNKIGDRGWAARAEDICEAANERREELADFRRVDPDDAAMLDERADIVDRATDIVEEMVDDVVAVDAHRREGPGDRARLGGRLPDLPAEPPRFRRRRSAAARTSRSAKPRIEGVPISERIGTFAGDNEMESCAPPRDLSI